MAKKSYIVITPLRTGGKNEDGTKVSVEPGKAISLEEKEAQPLLDCGAIRPQDIVESDKKAGKSDN